MPKKMTAQDISSRTKDKHYITLSSDDVVYIVGQLPPDQQIKCFGNTKKITPLSKIETGGILVQTKTNDPRPIADIPIAERRKIIKDLSTKDADLKKFLEDNNLWDRSQVVEEKEVAGDFSPSKFWSVLDEIVKDLKLTK